MVLALSSSSALVIAPFCSRPVLAVFLIKMTARQSFSFFTKDGVKTIISCVCVCVIGVGVCVFVCVCVFGVLWFSSFEYVCVYVCVCMPLCRYVFCAQ